MLSDKKIDIQRRPVIRTTTGSVLIQDEGVDVGLVGTLNFTGTTVEAQSSTGRINIIVSDINWYLEIFDVTAPIVSSGIVTLSNTPIDGSELVMLNGLPVHRDLAWDYQMSGKNVIFNAGHNLTEGDTIRVKYQILT